MSAHAEPVGSHLGQQTSTRPHMGRSDSVLEPEKAETDSRPTTGRSSGTFEEYQQVSSAPNGGLVAWLQVLGSFFLWFNTWGLVNAFGAFQTYYELGPLSSHSPSTIAWIGSVQSYLMLLVGALTGPLFDKGHLRLLLATGTVLVVLGMMMTSICNTLWQLMLAQGFCVGIGMGCLFVPSLGVVGTFFEGKKIFVALGLAASGSGLGGTLYPIILYRLQPTIGAPWATRVVAFIALGLLAIANIVMRVRTTPTVSRKLFDLSAWKDVRFISYVAAATVVFLGIWTPFFYVGIYALQEGITSPTMAFYLLPIIAAGSIFGRIIPNVIAVRLGMFNVVIACVLITGTLAFCFIAAKTQADLIALSVLYGFFSGSCVSILPALGMQIFPDPKEYGTRIGMACATLGLGLLAGTPIAGQILTRYGFTAMWSFSGSAALTGALLLIVARGICGGWSLMKKM